jgi:hypothetical protein
MRFKILIIVAVTFLFSMTISQCIVINKLRGNQRLINEREYKTTIVLERLTNNQETLFKMTNDFQIMYFNLMLINKNLNKVNRSISDAIDTYEGCFEQDPNFTTP